MVFRSFLLLELSLIFQFPKDFLFAFLGKFAKRFLSFFCSCASNVCLFVYLFLFVCFFSMWDFVNEHSPITGLQGKEESILLTPLYHFYLPHRHIDIGRQDDYCRELTKFSSENHLCFVLSVLFSLYSSFL